MLHYHMYYYNYSLAVDLLMCSFHALSVMPGAKYIALRKHILQLVMVSGYLLNNYCSCIHAATVNVENFEV